ncbi:hypothetical protein DID76_04575 [Candidatus Marinamargulisbacteria bacterium SCGC AG-414-C22]|nr:hypothetical protein DID76_04575 [Candidatus Marinamargulisbacteria bacterium SCGC AG-414-C22]
MASIKVRRLRFYALIVVLVLLITYLWLKPATAPQLDSHSIQLQAKQTIVDEIKITVSPFLDNTNNQVIFHIAVETYESKDIIPDDLNDIMFASHGETLFETGIWTNLFKNNYLVKGTLVFNAESEIQSPLKLSIFFLQDFSFTWEIPETNL